MSLDHTKKCITDKLKSDDDFRARVANFILYRGFSDDFKNFKKENLTQHLEDNGHKSEFSDNLQGYEFWVG